MIFISGSKTKEDEKMVSEGGFDTTLVRLHVNVYRQIHHSPPVVYHTGQASLAQASADRLLISGTYEPKARSEGENVLVFNSIDDDATNLVKTAVDSWYSEFNNYDFTQPGVTTIKTEKFTRLVWKSTRRIGAGIACSSATGNKTVVVVMRFDPPGNRINMFSANVLPSGVEHLVLDDFYTKVQSDDRFLSVSGLDSYVSVAETSAINAAEAKVAEVQDELDASYYKRYEIHDLFTGLDAYESFSNIVRNEYYLKGSVDAKLQDLRDYTGSNISGLSNAVTADVSNIYDEIYRVETKTDDVNAALAAQIDRFDALSNVLESEYYDKLQTDEIFATIASLEALESNIGAAFYDKQESDALFNTVSTFDAFSNYVVQGYFDADTSDARFTHITTHQALANDLAENYYDRTASDAKFAGRVNFVGLSNLLGSDYFKKVESLDRFAPRSNVDALAESLSDDYFDKQQSDVRFVFRTAFDMLSQDVGSNIQDLVGLSNEYTETKDDILTNLTGIRSGEEGLRLTTNSHGVNGSSSNIRYFSVSNIEDTDTGLITESNVEILRILENGFVGIGTSDPQARLHVVGDVYTTSGYVQASDRDLKENISRITGALEKVRRIGGYTFNMKTSERGIRDARRHAGVLAQEVLEVLPEAVTFSDTDKTYGVSYGDIIALLIEAVNDISIRLSTLSGPEPDPILRNVNEDDVCIDVCDDEDGDIDGKNDIKIVRYMHKLNIYAPYNVYVTVKAPVTLRATFVTSVVDCSREGVRVKVRKLAENGIDGLYHRSDWAGVKLMLSFREIRDTN
jgi:hypothetical protein